MECKNEGEAQKTLKTLPLVEENISEFQLFTLLPYSGLDRIFTKKQMIIQYNANPTVAGNSTYRGKN
jgi:hypothetical protein